MNEDYECASEVLEGLCFMLIYVMKLYQVPLLC